MIRDLPRVVAAPDGKPVRAEAKRSQQRALRLATQPDSWSRDEAAAMAAEFDEMAATWEGDRGGYRPPVLADALGTGAPFYLPADALVQAMATATGRAWDATRSEAYWGSWAVLRADPGGGSRFGQQTLT